MLGFHSQRSGIVERSAHETRIAALPDRSIALARTFGTRGRVRIPPEDLGPKGDLNDWLPMGATGDPAVSRSVLGLELATSPTPWALQIQRLPSDLPPMRTCAL